LTFPELLHFILVAAAQQVTALATGQLVAKEVVVVVVMAATTMLHLMVEAVAVLAQVDQAATAAAMDFRVL
jgi:hypothetical protein